MVWYMDAKKGSVAEINPIVVMRYESWGKRRDDDWFPDRGPSNNYEHMVHPPGRRKHKHSYQKSQVMIWKRKTA